MANTARLKMMGLALVFGLLSGLSPAHAQNPTGGNPTSSQVDGGFRLGPGDVVGIFVWQWPDLSRSAPISPDGRLSFPLIGNIDAAGMALDELARSIEIRLRSHVRDPQLTVTLDEVHSYRVFVTGEVIRPGMFELPGSTTVVQAIAMAGGFTPFARRDSVLVYSRGAGQPNRTDFDYDAFIEGDASAPDILLKPGDTVIVR